MNVTCLRTPLLLINYHYRTHRPTKCRREDCASHLILVPVCGNTSKLLVGICRHSALYSSAILCARWRIQLLGVGCLQMGVKLLSECLLQLVDGGGFSRLDLTGEFFRSDLRPRRQQVIRLPFPLTATIPRCSNTQSNSSRMRAVSSTTWKTI